MKWIPHVSFNQHVSSFECWTVYHAMVYINWSCVRLCEVGKKPCWLLQYPLPGLSSVLVPYVNQSASALFWGILLLVLLLGLYCHRNSRRLQQSLLVNKGCRFQKCQFISEGWLVLFSHSLSFSKLMGHRSTIGNKRLSGHARSQFKFCFTASRDQWKNHATHHNESQLILWWGLSKHPT